MQRIAYIFQYECPLSCVVLRQTLIYIYMYVPIMLYGILEVFSLCILEFPPLFVCVFKTTYHKANKKIGNYKIILLNRTVLCMALMALPGWLYYCRTTWPQR